MSPITSLGGATATTSGVSASPSKGSASKTDFDAILAKLKKIATQTPAERAREAVLKKHKLTEQEYQHLPDATRTAIDREIAEAARLAMEQQTHKSRVRAPRAPANAGVQGAPAQS